MARCSFRRTLIPSGTSLLLLLSVVGLRTTLGFRGATPHLEGAQPALVAPSRPIDPSYLELLEWRLIGPSRGGRSVAVAGDPKNRLVAYMGTTGGGVWKTEDGGYNWRNISDGYFRSSSVGAIAVAPSDPNIIYAGMGESCFRGDAMSGDGVYKSLDGGKASTQATRASCTWRHSATDMGRVRTVVFTARRTAERPGRRFSSGTTIVVPSTCAWIPGILGSYMQPFSSSAATLGVSAAPGRARASLKRQMVATRGPS
jgi:hypothetical protein